jgi:16S rRNA (uracil1498-N3)-methyltransferase
MIRLFLPPEQLTSHQISITGEQSKHLSVLRVKPGEFVTLFDGQGYKYECKLIAVHKKEVLAEVVNKVPHSAESPVSITLVQGIAKGDKMDFIIQKSTELGVRKIIPLITERSQVRHTEKIERWRKIALSASEQSGRDMIPEIDGSVTFNDFLSSSLFPPVPERKLKVTDEGFTNIGIIFSEAYKNKNLKNVLSGINDVQEINILIGPEGGFSKEEFDAAVGKGYIEVSLGPRILRTETAPIAAISIIQYELGDMG